LPAQGKSWVAHRIGGRKSEKCDGTIHAHTREEAEAKAHALFGAVTSADKARIYVREI
jgi:hypothetical protein